MNDSPHSWRPSDFDRDRLKSLIHEDLRESNLELANLLDYNQSTIVFHGQS